MKFDKTENITDSQVLEVIEDMAHTIEDIDKINSFQEPKEIKTIIPLVRILTIIFNNSK